MRKITNAEESNQYYSEINRYIDEYLGHKITPTNLHKYFKKASKMDSFLKKYKLDDVQGIKKVVHDVLEDRVAGEKDGIIKFEKFILNEDLGLIMIKESDISYEKVLADLYHSSVGHVEVTNKQEHKYLVNDFGEKKNIIIYSKEDIIDFKKSILPILLKKSKSETIDLHKVDLGLSSGKEIRCGISFGISEIIDESKLESLLSKKLGNDKVLEIITSFINDYDILRSGKVYKYFKEFNSNYIWELGNKM